MQSSSEYAVRWLPRVVSDCAPRVVLVWIVLTALAIRLYLSLTSFCIAGDGVGYLSMAHDFAAGAPAHALASVFSPLYPLIIAGVHVLIPDWELAGNLASAVLGTAAIATIFLMTRAAWKRDDLAIGAAALAAIHPELAAYSASVRTEAGFVFLLTAAIWMLIVGLERRRLATIAAAGLIGGLAYLYRTEAIGLPIFVAGFVPLAALWWKRWTCGWAIVAAVTFSVAFLIVASPYLIYLRRSTGHWSTGREFNAAMMYGIGQVAPDAEHWQRLGYSANASPFAAIAANPRLYLDKVARDFCASFYGFVQALGVLPSVLLAIGLWWRRRSLLGNFAEAMLALFTAFYVVGFSFSYTGTRFMVHLIPFTFGWVMAGLEATAAALDRLRRAGWRTRLPQWAPAIALALIMLPQTLWPIGYDMRGVRYAGAEIARRSAGRPITVVARDGRFAYYADASFVLLPARPIPNLCEWLGTHRDAGYLALSDRDEQRLGIIPKTRCLSLMHRYPRYGAGYYDLFEVRHSK